MSSSKVNQACSSELTNLGWLEPWRSPEDCAEGGLSLVCSLAPLFSDLERARDTSMHQLYYEKSSKYPVGPGNGIHSHSLTYDESRGTGALLDYAKGSSSKLLAPKTAARFVTSAQESVSVGVDKESYRPLSSEGQLLSHSDLGNSFSKQSESDQFNPVPMIPHFHESLKHDDMTESETKLRGKVLSGKLINSSSDLGEKGVVKGNVSCDSSSLSLPAPDSIVINTARPGQVTKGNANATAKAETWNSGSFQNGNVDCEDINDDGEYENDSDEAERMLNLCHRRSGHRRVRGMSTGRSIRSNSEGSEGRYPLDTTDIPPLEVDCRLEKRYPELEASQEFQGQDQDEDEPFGNGSENNFGEEGHFACVPGDTLNCRYLLVRLLGTGRSSRVWLAMDLEQCSISRRQLIRELGEAEVKKIYNPKDHPLFVAIKVFRCGNLYNDCASYEAKVLTFINESLRNIGHGAVGTGSLAREQSMMSQPSMGSALLSCIWKKGNHLSATGSELADSSSSRELPEGAESSPLIAYKSRISSIRDYFTVEGEFGTYPCIVMDVVGASVDAAINETQLQGIPPDVSRTILTTALEGLSLLAALYIIHTDIKPENLLFEDLEENVAKEMSNFQTQHLGTSPQSHVWNGSSFRRMSVAEYQRRKTHASVSQSLVMGKEESQASLGGKKSLSPPPNLLEEGEKCNSLDKYRMVESPMSHSINGMERLPISSPIPLNGDTSSFSGEKRDTYMDSRSTSFSSRRNLCALSFGEGKSSLFAVESESQLRSQYTVRVTDFGLSFIVPPDLRSHMSSIDGERNLHSPGIFPSAKDCLSDLNVKQWLARGDEEGVSEAPSPKPSQKFSSNHSLSGDKIGAGKPDLSRPSRPVFSRPANQLNGKLEGDILRRQNYMRGLIVQSREYRSPEVILGNYFLPSCDVWSMGCIAYELITGRFLFDPSEARSRADRMRLDASRYSTNAHLHELEEEERKYMLPFYYDDPEKDLDVFHIKSMMRLLGPPPKEYLLASPLGVYVKDFFDEKTGQFLFLEQNEYIEFGYDRLSDVYPNLARHYDHSSYSSSASSSSSEPEEVVDYDTMCTKREAKLKASAVLSHRKLPIPEKDPSQTTAKDSKPKTINYPVLTPAWREVQKLLKIKLDSKAEAKQFENFLLKCLQWDPIVRSSAADLLNDPWLCQNSNRLPRFHFRVGN